MATVRDDGSHGHAPGMGSEVERRDHRSDLRGDWFCLCAPRKEVWFGWMLSGVTVTASSVVAEHSVDVYFEEHYCGAWRPR